MDLALQNNDLDAWRQDLFLLRDVWADDGARGYLEDVRISKQKRQDRLRQTFTDRLSPLALNLVLLLSSRGRTNLIPHIVRQFEDIERAREQTVLVRVTVAEPLAADQRAQLERRLQQQTGKEISLEVAEDPAIMGGLVVRVGDRLLDLSVAGRLRRMREQLVGRR